MSTRSNIAIRVDNSELKNRYIIIYCHHDGYINGVGKKLLEKYNTYESAYELILQGDCSSLGCPYKESGDYHEFNIKEDFPEVMEDYLYVFAYGEWFVSDKSGKYKNTLLKSCFELSEIKDENNIVSTKPKVSNEERNDSKVLVDKGFLCELQGFLQGLNTISPSGVYEHYIKKIEGYCE